MKLSFSMCLSEAHVQFVRSDGPTECVRLCLNRAVPPNTVSASWCESPSRHRRLRDGKTQDACAHNISPHCAERHSETRVRFFKKRSAVFASGCAAQHRVSPLMRGVRREKIKMLVLTIPRSVPKQNAFGCFCIGLCRPALCLRLGENNAQGICNSRGQCIMTQRARESFCKTRSAVLHRVVPPNTVSAT